MVKVEGGLIPPRNPSATRSIGSMDMTNNEHGVKGPADGLQNVLSGSGGMGRRMERQGRDFYQTFIFRRDTCGLHFSDTGIRK